MKIPLVDLKVQYLNIKPEIDVAIQEVLDNTSFIMGSPVKNFEENLAKFCGCGYGIGVSSGSAALFLALKAYGIKEGDEVITVPNSFIATVEAIVQCGATPVFVDVEEETMLMDTKKIEEKITSKTKAIIPVHLYGQICDMDSIIRIARKYDLFIVEDAAQAIDAEYKNKKLPISDTAIFSFFPAKNLGCYGDGGAIITNNKEIAEKTSKLRDHGRISKYESDIIGYGERLDALQAAVLNVKLKHLEEWTKKRRENSYIYNELLERVKGVKTPFEEKHSKHVYYMYIIKINKRNELMNFLKTNEISTGIHYPIPLHLQPSLKFLGYKKGDFPIAEQCTKQILSLPMYPELTKEKIRMVVNFIKKLV
ncbi:DegT/DnrJ/EryC1/StrS family aminotransferase [Nanoarchaeota archaeon]